MSILTPSPEITCALPRFDRNVSKQAEEIATLEKGSSSIEASSKVIRLSPSFHWTSTRCQLNFVEFCMLSLIWARLSSSIPK